MKNSYPAWPDEELLKYIPFGRIEIPNARPQMVGTYAGAIAQALGGPRGPQGLNQAFYKPLHEALDRLEKAGRIMRSHPRWTPRRIVKIK